MTWQPEPVQSSPAGPASDDGPGSPDDQLPARQPGSRRSGLRLVVCAALLAAGIAGLAVSVLGIAHNLLPRQFTAAQRRQITDWEWERHWRVLPAGRIFPASVSYSVLANDLNAGSNLTLHATLLQVSPESTCSAALTGAAGEVLKQHGCSAAMRATYVDASGSLVATVAVAVMPSMAAEQAVVQDLTEAAAVSGSPVQTLAVADSPASDFGDPQRQVTTTPVGRGTYVILSTAGFADGRRRVRLAADLYLRDEITSFTTGLVSAAVQALGNAPSPVVCPSAPGC